MVEGSDGREGKYFEWRAERKLGFEGSRSGGLGAWGKCILGGGGVREVWEAGCRSDGGSSGGASASEDDGEFGISDFVVRIGSCSAPGSSNETFLKDGFGGECSSP